MKNLLLVALALILTHTHLHSEGSRELAPNAVISITNMNGTFQTNDIAALNLNHPDYQNFASYDNPQASSRLHIHITDPQQEAIHLGFSSGTRNVTGMTQQFVDYEYRVIDPNGNVIYGPIQVLQGNGNASTWQLATTGPDPIYPGGYIPQTVTSSDLMAAGWSGPGDYYIEFRELLNNDRFLINYWDITVFNHSQPTQIEKKGRVWSQNWALFAINDFDFPNRPFNGAFYVCAEDPSNPDAAFITKVDFNGSGFRPAAFNIAFNSFGVLNTGNIQMDRQSAENINSTTPEYEIFLNDPVDLCESASGGQIEVIGIGRCGVTDFCIKYQTSQPGQIEVLLDFDGNDGEFTPGSADRLLSVTVDSNEVNKPMCLDWDGKNGLGIQLVQSGQTKIPVVISYAQGIYHFPIFDAELLTDGLTIQSVRPSGPSPLLYYDDSRISAPSGSGEPQVQLSGCNQPCHKWTNYTNGAAIGFGNLNTINSWWFSQQIVEAFVFDMPAFMTCQLDGIGDICPGDTGIVVFTPQIQPMNADQPTVASIQWTGPSILGSRFNDTMRVNGPGVYTIRVHWINSLGDTCDFECIYEIEEKENTSIVIDTLLLRGDTAVIYDEAYSEAGTYMRTIPSNEECDTLLTINVRIIETILHYDFDDCRSFKSDSTHQDYTEFEAKYPDPISCADVSAQFLRRENPEVNTHSCTPGVLGSPAMCVSSLDDCNFDAGNEKSVVFEVTLTPQPDTAASITGLCFWERAPEMFDWLSGTTGPNNYPTQYGIRVLKDGTEIFRQVNIPTTTDWTKETFDFKGIREFTTTTAAKYRFELLGYCLVGDTSMVTAWDLDELSVMASCVSPTSSSPFIGGNVWTTSGHLLPNSYIQLAGRESTRNEIATSGEYIFKENKSQIYQLSGYKDDDHLNGVSTKDIIFIMRHLFGKAPLEGPYNYIAADVNKSNSISISDASELQKLILGKSASFSNNTSWRLGDRYQELSVDNPWSFVESIDVRLEDNDQLSHDFIGVKTGDVTGDAQIGKGLNHTRNEQVMPLSFERVDFTDDVERINFYLDAKDVYGIQVALDLNAHELLSVIPGQCLLTENNFYLNQDGVLKITWSDVEPVKSSNDALFSILLSKSALTFDESNIEAKSEMNNEVYIGDALETFTLFLMSKTENKISDNESTLRVYPNPVRNEVHYDFVAQESGTALISLYDLQGRLLLERQQYISNKNQRVTIFITDIQALPNGPMIYRVTLNSNQYTGTLIKG